jgi:virulence-associated protein VapD
MLAGVGHNSGERGTVYAITFDRDTTRMPEVYPGERWRNGYTEIGRILREHGFDWQQGSVYFGSETVDAVTCVLAIKDVARRLNLVGPSVRDVRMLRIEEFNDLGPAVEDLVRPRGN